MHTFASKLPNVGLDWSRTYGRAHREVINLTTAVQNLFKGNLFAQAAKCVRGNYVSHFFATSDISFPALLRGGASQNVAPRRPRTDTRCTSRRVNAKMRNQRFPAQIAFNGSGKRRFVYLNPAPLYQTQTFGWQLLGRKTMKRAGKTPGTERDGASWGKLKLSKMYTIKIC